MSMLNRRAVVVGVAAALPAAAAASIPALAEPDPALAVAARARAAHDALTVALEGGMEPDEDGTGFFEQDEDDAAYFDMIHTTPTSLEGLAAVVAVMVEEQERLGSTDGEFHCPYFHDDEDAYTFIKTLNEALRRLTGAAS